MGFVVGLLLGLIGHEGVVMWFRCLRLSVLVLLVGACAPVEVPHQPVSPVSTIVPTILVTAPVSPSASESVAVSGDPSPSPSDADLAAAEQAVSDYYELRSRVQKSADFDIEKLKAVVTGPLLDQEVPSLLEDRDKGILRIGDYVVSILSSRRLDSVTIEVETCVDTRNTDLVDRKSGNSVLEPTRSRISKVDLAVKLIDEKWRVYFYYTKAVESC